MKFSNPGGWWAFSGLVMLLLSFLFRAKPVQRTVSNLYLWRLAENRFSRTIRLVACSPLMHMRCGTMVIPTSSVSASAAHWGDRRVRARESKEVDVVEEKDDVLHVEGGKPLHGTIKVRGAKNFVSKAMVAALLAPGKSVLKNVPEIF